MNSSALNDNSLMRENGTWLVADAVRGKLDVGSVAHRFPLGLPIPKPEPEKSNECEPEETLAEE
jgi:hypothetical protein